MIFAERIYLDRDFKAKMFKHAKNLWIEAMTIVFIVTSSHDFDFDSWAIDTK